jgi:DNA-binding LytR/AlgR family response regulator
MHIAICDDNIADRHQSERLIGRESERRKTDEEGYYVDSYGSFDAVMPTGSMYDLFFIDLADSPEGDGLDLVCALQKAGAPGYFVLCSSSIDYKKRAAEMAERIPYPTHIRHLNKPILVDELRAVIDELTPLAEDRMPMIELRGVSIGDTAYVLPSDIICAQSDGFNTTVKLDRSDRKEIVVPGDAYILFRELEDNPYFYPTHDKRGFVNITHVKSTAIFRVEMNDGSVIKTSPYYSKQIREKIKELGI